jgi:hypothetical protein
MDREREINSRDSLNVSKYSTSIQKSFMLIDANLNSAKQTLRELDLLSGGNV